MNEKTKRILSVVYILFTIALVFVLGVWMGDIGASWNALKNLDLLWVLAALGCSFGYWCARAVALKYFCARQGHRLRFTSALRIAIIGLYYSGITPAATGGQPLQIYELNKCGVPVGVGSSAMIVKFICFQTALLVLGLVCWITHAQQVRAQLEGTLWLVRIGFGINLSLTLLIVLLMVKQSIVAWLMRMVVRVGSKLRIIRDPELFTKRVEAQLAEFQRVVRMLIKRPTIVASMLSFAFVQVLLYMSVVYCLYRGFGLTTATYGFTLTIQLLLFMTVSFMPTPGASGAQEGGFILFFRGFFSETSIFAALLSWRFFTYYLTLIVGAAVVVISTFIKKRQGGSEAIESAADDPPLPPRHQE